MKQIIQTTKLSGLIFLFIIVTSISNANAQAPTITSFTPNSGTIGTLVTINGTNLSNPTSISIGGVNAIKISGTNVSLVAMIMPGAITGNIVITNLNASVTSNSIFTITLSITPTVQQGNKLVGTGNTGAALQGVSLSISADGNTAIVGGIWDNSYQGAAWIYTRIGGVWSQQGNKLVGTGNIGTATQGNSVGISADGNTAIVGGTNDSSGKGAVWIYIRSGGVWSQQGNKLVGTGGSADARQGWSVNLSADGNTALVTGFNDNGQGAAWIYSRSNGVWSQQGNKLVGTGSIGFAQQGYSSSISADGNTAIVGGIGDNSDQGAVWIYTRIAGVWSQQGNKIVGTGNVGIARQGSSVSLSADGNTAIIGGQSDNNNQGAIWIFTRSGSTWTQQGSKKVGTGNVGFANLGCIVSVNANGNTIIAGGTTDNNSNGAVWIYTRNGVNWNQQNSKLIGTGNIGAANQGAAASISADGNTVLIGGYSDNNNQGAVWVFNGALSNNANLSAMTINIGTLTPNFADSTLTYNTNTTASSITVTPTKADTNATIQVRLNGGIYSSVISGAQSGSLTLNMGTNTINVRVTAQDGIVIKTYTINVLRIFPPNISSFLPTTGPIGTLVTIYGNNFNSTATNNIVYFGTIKAIVTEANDSVLKVLAPVGIINKEISVTTNGLTAISKMPFIQTFQGPSSFTATSFYPKDTINSTIQNTYFTISADFNNDGKIDLAALDGSVNAVYVKQNTTINQVTSFASKVSYPAGNSPVSASTADIDGDGLLDLLIANSGSSSISIYRNTSTLTSISFANKIDFSTTGDPTQLAIKDLDGDGMLDIAVSTDALNSISLFRNTSSIGIISLSPRTNIALGRCTGISFDDIDGDGKTDISISLYWLNKISILKNNSTLGNISFSTNIDFTVNTPLRIVTGDLDGDSKKEIIVSTYGNSSVSIFKNISSGGSIFLASKIDYTAGTEALGLSINDLNGDGKMEIITANYSPGTISVLKNNSTSGTINFGSKVDYPVGSYPWNISIADLNLDSLPDIIVPNQTTSNSSFLIHNVVSKNAKLNSIAINSGILSPSFADSTIAYITNTTASSIIVTPTKADLNATIQVRINGGSYATVNSGSASAALALNLGNNTLEVKVTAQDTSVIKIYTLTITRLAAISPTIASYTPTRGSIGTLVIITGNNLSNPTSISIGGVNAIKISASANSITALVMPGAVTGAVIVTTAAGTDSATNNFIISSSIAPNVQQGNKLVGTGCVGGAFQGRSVSLSADGNTAIVGGSYDNNGLGAAWIYTRSGNTWTQQGNKLVGTGSVGQSFQGYSVSLSADGNTAIVGGAEDNDYQGAAWVYTRSGSTWTQQGNKLVGTGMVGLFAFQGHSVSLSADGNTAIVGGYGDSANHGAAWVYTRSFNTWTQQGNKLVGTGTSNIGIACQGTSVSLSADGNTALVGGALDNGQQGAVWVFKRSGNSWTQQGNKLVGTGSVGQSYQGISVSLSADGNTAIVGGNGDNNGQGALWVFTRSGNTWTQQGSKFVGTGNVGAANQGSSVSLSADGNIAIVGGRQDNNNQGAAWVYTRSGNTWSQQGNKLVGTGSVGNAQQGSVLSLSADGNTAIVGGSGDNSGEGAAWVYYVALSADSNLSALTISSGTINPSFSSTVVSYTTSVSNGITNITLTPTIANSNASVQVRINGSIYTRVNSGSASGALALNVGSNTIEIKVTAQNGTSIKIYTITVTRAGSNNADLSALILSVGTLNPAFASASTSYTASISNAITSLTVTPTRSDSNASIQVRVNGGTYASVGSASASIALALNVGSNTINVLVTAQDASTKTYTISVTRAGSPGSTLNIIAFIEGLYLGSSNMTAAPFNADGITSNTIADTLTIVLHDKNNFDSVFAVTSTIDTSGLASFNLPAIYIGNAYYIAIKHRNSLETWTDDTVLITSTTSYNFSDNAFKAYGSNLVELGSGVFGIYSGDINQDGFIDGNDFTDVDNDKSNFASGYLYTDTNGDGFVDGNDFTLIDNNGSMFISIARP